jgi:DNA end-binding protein Ku
MASTVWRGYVTFGLISIPVRLFRAARPERVNLRRLFRSEHRSEPAAPEQETESEEAAPIRSLRRVPERVANVSKETVLEPPPPPILEPVRQASVRGSTDEVLPERVVVKGFEYEKDRFVALEPEELKNIEPKTATEMQIEEFVNLTEVDPVYFETSYYVVPEDAGKKAYALLFRALQTTNLVAVAQFAMHSREHVVLLRPGKRGLIAHTMFFSSEVRGDEEFRADLEAVTAKELGLAETLIHQLTASFEPQKYRDTYREKLESLIAKKVAGEPIEQEAAPVKAATVVDITEALQRSLAALKKPPVSDASATRSPTVRPRTKRAGR